MPHELIVESQAAFVDDPVLVDHDGIVERSAQRQAHGPQLVDFSQETEGSGLCHLALVCFVIHADRPALASHHGVVELDLEVDLECVAGQKGDAAVRFADGDRLEYFQYPARRLLVEIARALDHGDERRGASVHGRNLFAVQFDQGIVYAAPQEGRHEVFYCGDRDPATIGQHGAQRPFDHVLPGRRDLDRSTSQAGPPEPDSRLRTRRMDGHRDI